VSRLRRMLLAWLAICWLWPLPGPALAGVTAEVEPRDVEQGDPVVLRVLVDGEAPADIDVSGITDFTVTPRGRALGTKDPAGLAVPVAAYRFELLPRRTGELVIPSLAVTEGGQVVHTPAFRVRVRPRPIPPRDLAGQDLALYAVVSTAEPFVGEQFLYTLRLYRLRAVETVAITPPDFPGFVATPLPGQRDGEVTVVGRRFATTEVDYLLRPTRPGRVTLGPGSATCQEAVDPGRARGSRTRTCAGPSLVLTVRPLPPFPGPGHFSGLVGRVELAARLAAPDPGQGPEPVLVATLTGQGNLPEVAPPVPILPPGQTARPLPPRDEGTLGPAGYQGTRTFRYALSVAPPDSLALPEIVLPVFDPAKAVYVTLRAKPAILSPLTPARPGQEANRPLPLPPTADHETAPPSWPALLAGALIGPALYLAADLRIRRRRKSPSPNPPAPSVLAEALRQAVLEHPDRDQIAARQALERLDRLLYSGQPADAATLLAATREASRHLAELAP
jgi:hypothetical protein